MQAKFDVVVVREDGQWVAQCLQHDIAAQGDTATSAVNELGVMMAVRYALGLRDNFDAFGTVPRPPECCQLAYFKPQALPLGLAPKAVRVNVGAGEIVYEPQFSVKWIDEPVVEGFKDAA